MSHTLLTRHFYPAILGGCISLFLFGSLLTAADLDSLNNGSVQLNGEYNIGMMSNRTIEGWSVRSSGLQKRFSYNQNIADSDWKTYSMNTVMLSAGFKLNKAMGGIVGIDAFGGYYDTLWQPINDIHRRYNEGTYARIRNADITYAEDHIRARYFRGVGHYNWKSEGDMFGLYVEQFETDRYLNISGRAVPDGGELEFSGQTFGSLLIVGGEPVWGNKDSLYAKYNSHVAMLDTTLLYKRENIPYGDPNEVLEAYGFSTKYHALELGVMYQPFRVDRPYKYVTKVADGPGDYGSKYQVHVDSTTKNDALGYALTLAPKNILTFDEILLKYTYQGLVAGNKSEFLTRVSHKVGSTFKLTGTYTERVNLKDAMPYVHDGTTQNPGAPDIVPRGPESPFWVTNDNRAASIFNLNLTYDPSPTAWSLYKYEPANLEWWNLNSDNNVGLACGLGYTLTYYPTTTDRQYYWNENGSVVWEPYDVHGMWATARPVHFVDFVVKSNIEPRLNVLLCVRGGESLSTGGMSYADSTHYKPKTDMFSADAQIGYAPCTLILGYGSNVWGPEDWHRRFGITVNRLYKVGIAYDFRSWGEVGLSYMKIQQDDYKTLPTYQNFDLGSFDEAKMSWTFKFNGIFNFKEPLIAEGPSGLIVAEDKTPPTIKASSTSNGFTPNNDGINDTISFPFSIDDPSGIDTWSISIKDANGKEVIHVSGNGKAPQLFEWDGRDTTKRFVQEGTYSFVVGAVDAAGNNAESTPIYFNVNPVTKIITKDFATRMQQYGDITEEDRGIVIILPTSMLFKTSTILDKNAIDTLNALVAMLQAQSYYKLRIEGYTDARGRASYNQEQSMINAKAIADYLKEKGIPSEKLDVIGMGGDRPRYPDNTDENRDKNNRVEIVIIQ